MSSQAGGDGCALRCVGRRDRVPDAVLVRRFRRGDNSAYDALASRHLSAVNAVVCRALYERRGRVDPEARDRLVQEALIKACTRIGQCRQPDRFAQWLGRIAHRTVADDARRMIRSREVPASLLQDSDEGGLWRDPRYGRHGVLGIVAEAEEVARLAPLVRRALQCLSAGQRRIVTLRYREGMKNKEIARKTGLDEHTVSSHLCEGKKRIRQFLDRAESNGLQGPKDAAASGAARHRAGPGAPSGAAARPQKTTARRAKA